MRVIVDFQTVEGDTVWALTSHVRDESLFEDLSDGSLVLLDDAEGRTASGVIEAIEPNGLMSICVIWETFQDVSVFGVQPVDFGVPVGAVLVQNPQSRTGSFAAA